MKKKLPKCKCCKERFVPFNNNSLQKYCMEKDECVKAFYLSSKEKLLCEKVKVMKEGLLTHKDYIKLLQTVFNTYIRKRDKDLPCVSCGTLKAEEFHAGHYIASTFQYLRFNEFNVWKQCSRCNTHLRGNSIPYRIELINRIGLQEVERLENERHLKFDKSIPELKELIKIYREKVKQLK